VSEFDELVAADGVLMAGRFGSDGRIAEYKVDPWYVANPMAADMAHWFCAAVTTMFGSMAYAFDCANRSGFDLPSWLPVKGWAYTGGDYLVVVRGNRFMIAERAKLGSLDELDHLLGSR
jgi:roadblock/LC7 domain-containing protein